MRLILRILQLFYSIYAMLVFLVFMFLMLPFVVLTSFFSARTQSSIIYFLATLWADGAMLFWGIWHKNIYEAPDDIKKPYVFVFNHISYIDIPILLKALRKHPIRVLGKAEISAIPLFGFIYKRAVIMVKRTDAADRAKSIAALKAALEQNISIVIAPEGTFNMSNKPLAAFYDGAFKIAIETQTPIKPVLFLDAYDRLHYNSVFSFTPGKSRAVFLKEIAVENYTLADLPVLKQQVYSIMEEALIRYKVTWINS